MKLLKSYPIFPPADRALWKAELQIKLSGPHWYSVGFANAQTPTGVISILQFSTLTWHTSNKNYVWLTDCWVSVCGQEINAVKTRSLSATFSAATYMPPCLGILNRLFGHKGKSSQVGGRPLTLLRQQLKLHILLAVVFYPLVLCVCVCVYTKKTKLTLIKYSHIFNK